MLDSEHSHNTIHNNEDETNVVTQDDAAAESNNNNGDNGEKKKEDGVVDDTKGGEGEESTPTTSSSENGAKKEEEDEGGADDAGKEDDDNNKTEPMTNGGTDVMDVDEANNVKKEEEVEEEEEEEEKGEDVTMKDAGEADDKVKKEEEEFSSHSPSPEQEQEKQEQQPPPQEEEIKSDSLPNGMPDKTVDEDDNAKKDDTTTAAAAIATEPQQSTTPAATTTPSAPVGEEKKTDEKPKPTTDSNNTSCAASAPPATTAAAASAPPATTAAAASAPPATTAAAASAPNPPPPVLKGTLSYNLDLRRHIIRGMWNYENSSTFPPQRFELLRTLDKTEDPKELPKDGEFHGSFSLAYYHTTSKGKQKERSKVITETGVKITFTKFDDDKNEYKVDGKGTNQFGIFHINGNATPSQHEGDPCYDIILRKRYEPSQQPSAAAARSGGADSSGGGASGGGGGGGPGGKKRKSMSDEGTGGDGGSGEMLPPPSESFPTGVVCLRGQLYKEDSEIVGATDVVHRINGMWSTGLDVILADPQNVQGLCNRFEYEHKSTVPSGVFPVSGRYSGWFHLTDANGQRQTISERDVNLRFTKNNAGYHNVEGKGSNVFGRYTISGTLSMDNVLTIFRHFKPLKIKTKAPSATSAPPPINKGGQSSRRPSIMDTFPEPRLTLDEVIVPGGDSGEALPPIQPPANTAYSAVSQGVLRLNDDGSHQCTGKWAVTREHFTSGQTSQFNFRLEPHFALEAVKELRKKEGVEMEEEPNTPAGTPMVPKDFPLDSALYKGSFQLKKKGTRYDTIVDQQIVMKFRQSTSGAYNVYGRGVNGIGTFNLIGTLIMRGKLGGQVELYRMYPPEYLTTKKAQAAPAPVIPGKGMHFPKPAAPSGAGEVAEIPMAPLVPSTSTSILPGPPGRVGLARRESSRLVKLPSRLEDDDPQAQLARIMEKCVVILRQTREKDIETGAFFSEPVDPDALGIPTYRQVINEPMDLGTVAQKLESNQIQTPEEFARLVRLVFENAIKFNVDPSHSVHLSARVLLVEFNKKFRDIERLLESLRRVHKSADLDEKGKKKKKEDGKKRKRGPEEPKSAKRRRLDEAQAMAAANANAMAAIVAAAPQGVPNAAVSRGEFNMMIHMIELLQKQIVQTHNAIAELTPGDESETAVAATATSAPAFDAYASLAGPVSAAPAAAPERKKTKKKAAEPAPRKVAEEPPPPPVVYDDNKPLTLQEQETLTDTINNMPPEHIPGVISIIRQSASLSGDEDEIDLEIDQLDTVTQRKLLRHVSKFIKQPKKKSKTTKKAKAAAPAPAPAPTPKSNQKKTEKPPAKKPASPKNTNSFFGVGASDSDSDSDDDDDEPPKQTAAPTPSGGKHFSTASNKSDGFDLGDSFSGLQDDNDDDLGNGGFTANWNISKPVGSHAEKDKGAGDDDDWGAAREAAEQLKEREADRKAREEKAKIEAERAKQERLDEAKKNIEDIKAQRLEEQEREKKEQEEKKKKEEEEKKRIREQIRQENQVEQTVDLDAQRDIMKEYEQSFLSGGASPSSDFGF